MSIAHRITQHIATIQALVRILNAGDHVGAGLSVTVRVGVNGSPVNVALAAGTETALQALLAAQRETLDMCAALARSEVRDIEAALVALAEFSGKHPQTRGV